MKENNDFLDVPIFFDGINAKEEFLYVVEGKSIKCAHIIFDSDDKNIVSVLKVGYSNEDYQTFLDSLDYEYEVGFGYQQMFGTIWLNDNTWFSRGEYDGSEWWEQHVYPDIVYECKQEVETPKEITLSKMDVCVICGKDTPYTIETHIDNRIGYIEGAGQGCPSPIICSQNRAKSVFTLSEALIHNTPNDSDLGHKVREIYWNNKNN